MRKAGDFITQPGYSINEEEAWPIIFHPSCFGEVIKQAWNDYDPSKIARYALLIQKIMSLV